MTMRLIDQFMWSYQEHSASSVRRLGENVLGELGVQLKPDVLLVGILKPGEEGKHPVCVEPEDGKWDLSLFTDIPNRYTETMNNHPLRRMIYGDEPSMRDKAKIRRLSATIVVQDS